MKKGTFLLIFILLITGFITVAQDNQKVVQTTKITEHILVDGSLSEDAWQKVEPATNFLERNPTEGLDPMLKTEVKVLYDENSIFIGAICYDSSPDSILAQLGERDDQLNADNFIVSFDTYNTKIDAFNFGVTASGVQSDSKFSDYSFNAVWDSKARITDFGWVVEMEIPYSAIRFPNKDIQTWNIQFEREIRRVRKQLQWALVPKNAENIINYWGKIEGLENIEAPLRLAFMPYLSSNYQGQGGVHELGYAGGADMKLGLNEGFTLDMTLIPDFSQARSDNVVKNLSAFEVVFTEQRPFFQEGVELFSLGNLFYTRRIGGGPIYYDNTYDYEKDSLETIVSNPQNTNILNVTKVSGRNKKGLGIGFLNGVTNSTHAVFEDTTGRRRKILTSPLTNYNILAFDQNLPNNSSAYVVNTNVARGANHRSANVTATGLVLANKANTYAGNFEFKLSNIYNLGEYDYKGTAYKVGAGKIRGNFKYNVSSEGISPNFDPNDLGVNFQTDIIRNNFQLQYNKYNPFWFLNNSYNTLDIKINNSYRELGVGVNHIFSNISEYNNPYSKYNNLSDLAKELNVLSVGYNYRGFFTLPSFHSFFINMEGSTNQIDLFESRMYGQPFLIPGFQYFEFGVSSDYRRPIAIDGHIGRGFSIGYGGQNYQKYNLSPILRFNDHFTVTPSTDILDFKGGVGAGWDENYNLIYGKRNVFTMTNILQWKFLFQNNLSLAVRFRHYWSKGTYEKFGYLSDDGLLIWDENINTNADFNFNAFNTDIVFAWQYGPGSFINIVYKTSLQQDETQLRYGYMDNLQYVLTSDQLNQLTFKIIYYLDVGRMIKKRHI